MVLNGVVATRVQPRVAVWGLDPETLATALGYLADWGIDVKDSGLRAPELDGWQVFEVNADRGRHGSRGLGLRALQVLQLVASGYTNPEIATELGIALGTVQEHLKRLFRKLGVSSREEAVLVALRVGWLYVDPLDPVFASWRADVDSAPLPDLASTVLPAVAAWRSGSAA
ncbi:hypothetical protein GCM10027258_63040 [Amycolatopsis stemonae]